MKSKVVVVIALAVIIAGTGPRAIADVSTPTMEVKSAPMGKATHQWIPVDQDVWTVFLEAPAYHFAKARDSLANNDARTAAAEIRKGALLLRFQANRLETEIGDLDQMADQVKAGKVKAGPYMNAVLAQASKALDYREPLIPVIQGKDELFIESGRYHVAEAKTKLASKDRSAAATEIRKAIVYLKLEAAHTGRDVNGDFKSALDDMETLAKKAENGADVAAQDVDQAFAKTWKALTSKK